MLRRAQEGQTKLIVARDRKLGAACLGAPQDLRAAVALVERAQDRRTPR
jgi:hypothetical protein